VARRDVSGQAASTKFANAERAWSNRPVELNISVQRLRSTHGGAGAAPMEAA
jgi:hypothetical protein